MELITPLPKLGRATPDAVTGLPENFRAPAHTPAATLARFRLNGLDGDT